MRGTMRAAAAAVGLAGLSTAEATKAAEVFVVHGIPGEDLGLDPALPVDVAVDGSCVLAGLEFGAVEGPLSLDPGTYAFEVSLASDDDCAGPLAIAGSFNLGITDTAAVVAHLDTNGDATATKFTVKDHPVPDHSARLSIYHTAAAPKVDVRVKDAHTGERVASIVDLANGDQSFPEEVAAGLYDVLISPSPGRKSRFLHPVATIPADLTAGDAFAVFAVGSLERGTFGVVPLVITP